MRLSAAFWWVRALGVVTLVACGGSGSTDRDAGDGGFDGGDADDGDSDGGDADWDADAEPELEQQPGLEIDISTGRVRGEEDGGLRVFLGIPFAEPPVGDRRLRPPVPVEPWDGTLEATDHGPSCPQQELGPELILGDFAGPQSEDCLFLNVWAYDDGRERPVMVFFYGGGFAAGAASWPLYDGAELARGGDVTVVTVNYRLGALGYLATPALADEEGNTAGNYGLQDQIEALRWVQQNIVAFGGDPDNVTIFGESAGAISVCAILGVPSADDLYHRAIIESGMCSLPSTSEGTSMSPTTAFDTGAAAVERLGCAEADDEVACLRALPVEDLVAVASLTDLMTFSDDALFLSPVIDGSLLAEPPQNRLSRGEADVPLIAGSNAVEGLLFAGFDLILTRGDLRDKVADYVGDEDLAADIVALYPILQFPIHRDAYIAFLGDVTFVCPGLAVVEDAAAGEPSFTYHFTRSPLLARPIGAVHSMELVYLFETFDALYLIPTATDTRMADTMQRAWGGFARSGAPPLESGWPAFDPADPAIAVLDDPASVTDELVGGRCEALEALGLSF